MNEDEATPAPLDLAVADPTPDELRIAELEEALRLTVEYVGPAVLPAQPGWAWFDALGTNVHEPESNLVTYAEDELRLAGLFDEGSACDGMIGNAVLDLVKLFAKQGHSGFSASITTDIANKLMRYEPLTPLTYAEDEWNHIADEMVADEQRPLYQNRRKSDVFSHDHGKTWYCLDGTKGVRE